MLPCCRTATPPALPRPTPHPQALQGPPLFDLLDSIEGGTRDAFAPFRMPIMDRYRSVGGWAGCCRRVGDGCRGELCGGRERRTLHRVQHRKRAGAAARPPALPRALGACGGWMPRSSCSCCPCRRRCTMVSHPLPACPLLCPQGHGHRGDGQERGGCGEEGGHADGDAQQVSWSSAISRRSSRCSSSRCSGSSGTGRRSSGRRSSCHCRAAGCAAAALALALPAADGPHTHPSSLTHLHLQGTCEGDQHLPRRAGGGGGAAGGEPAPAAAGGGGGRHLCRWGSSGRGAPVQSSMSYRL